MLEGDARSLSQDAQEALRVRAVRLVVEEGWSQVDAAAAVGVGERWHYYWKATNLAGLTDDTIAVIADHAYAASSPRSYAAMFHMGGAVARVPHHATAYAARDVAHNIIIDAVWLPEESGEHAAAETAWARRFLEALRPHRAAGVYVNFLDRDDDSSRVREAYGDQIYRRLADVKATYDPDNALHHNKNIQPG